MRHHILLAVWLVTLSFAMSAEAAERINYKARAIDKARSVPWKEGAVLRLTGSVGERLSDTQVRMTLRTERGQWWERIIEGGKQVGPAKRVAAPEQARTKGEERGRQSDGDRLYQQATEHGRTVLREAQRRLSTENGADSAFPATIQAVVRRGGFEEYWQAHAPESRDFPEDVVRARGGRPGQ